MPTRTGHYSTRTIILSVFTLIRGRAEPPQSGRRTVDPATSVGALVRVVAALVTNPQAFDPPDYEDAAWRVGLACLVNTTAAPCIIAAEYPTIRIF